MRTLGHRQVIDLTEVTQLLRDGAGLGNTGLTLPRGNYWQSSGSLHETECVPFNSHNTHPASSFTDITCLASAGI